MHLKVYQTDSGFGHDESRHENLYTSDKLYCMWLVLLSSYML